MRTKLAKGESLVELIIAIGIFIVVMVIALEAFLAVIKYNREAVQKQAVQDHAEFLFSLMTKEIRYARINYNNHCKGYFSEITNNNENIGPNATYLATDSDHELRFENYQELCVRYAAVHDDVTNTDRLKVWRHNWKPGAVGDYLPGETREAWVLPADINVADLKFSASNVFDQRSSDNPSALLQPPMVKYSIKLESNIWNPAQISFASIIVGRNFEQF